MKNNIFDVKRQRGENIVFHTQKNAFTHNPSKNRHLQTLHMNYYIFDVKRQRGENIVIHTQKNAFTHSPSKNRHLQTLHMNYNIFDVKRQRGENIVIHMQKKQCPTILSLKQKNAQAAY